MKQLTILLSLCLLLPLWGCSDDTPAEVSETDILGIWTAGDGVYLELDDTNWIYQYDLMEFMGENYWVKRKLSYLYEPVSQLMLKQDTDGLIQLYKVVSFDDNTMTLCWLETPMQEEAEGDARYEIIRVFFQTDYEIDPADCTAYEKITEGELTAALGDTEIIEAY